jgi:hypothetical protein
MFYIPTIKLASRAGVLLLSEVAPPYLIHPSNAFLGLDILIYSEIQKTEMFSINKKKNTQLSWKQKSIHRPSITTKFSITFILFNIMYSSSLMTYLPIKDLVL